MYFNDRSNPRPLTQKEIDFIIKSTDTYRAWMNEEQDRIIWEDVNEYGVPIGGVINIETGEMYGFPLIMS